MGDRATIRIKHHNSPTAIHLYTHWNGSDVESILADALRTAERDGRITDEAYCTRIIFDKLTRLVGNSTGYGIMIGDKNRPGDVQHDSPSVEWRELWAYPHISYHRMDGRMSVLQPYEEWFTDVFRTAWEEATL